MRLSAILALVVLAASVVAQTPAELTAYGKAYAAAKKALAAKPKDKKLQKAFVVAGDRYATATMNAPSLPPRTKYRGALRLYREVLKVDPKNKEAANNSKMIIDIYKSMGRPVPN
jgi:tetratricopeptide (TPR) repeat protein